jgi:uncharacterized protein
MSLLSDPNSFPFSESSSPRSGSPTPSINMPPVAPCAVGKRSVSIDGTSIELPHGELEIRECGYSTAGAKMAFRSHMSLMHKTFDVAIIGGGPAGLAAAARLTGTGFSVTLIDSGKPVTTRDRNNSHDATRGLGGAGLFSDGKFSFFPSATELWTLPRLVRLRSAYDWTCQQLKSAGLDTPPFPDYSKADTIALGEWFLKDYPSEYISLEDRLKLIANMAHDVDATVLTESKVVSATYNADADLFCLTLHDSDQRLSDMKARRLILATGRFGPLGLKELTGHWGFRRLEVGFRIQQSADRAFFRHMRQLDPKLRFCERDHKVEWRTFCACRQGEVLLTETNDLWTVSGRSDCPPTGLSNIGFNTRIRDERLAASAMATVLEAMADPECSFRVSMMGVLEGEPDAVTTLDKVYGQQLREIMARGVARLVDRFPDLHGDDSAVLVGPTLEGVGWYPKVDDGLRLLDTPAWSAGDACGLFRGIVAAMISGHYAADSVLHDLETTTQS